MMLRFWKFLRAPYPFYYGNKTLVWLMPAIFVFGTLFLYIFQPFDNNWEEHKYPFIIMCCIHSLTAVLSLYPVLLIAKMNIRDKSNWIISKEIVLILIAFVVIGVGNYLIRDLIYENESNRDIGYLMEELKNGFSILMIIYPLFLWFNSHRLKLKHDKGVALLNKELSEKFTKESHDVIIHNASGAPELKLTDEEFLFVKSEGNYIAVYYFHEQIEKKLIRNTLTSIADDYPDFFQPHRSYLVNFNAVSHISGDSRGYSLQFPGCNISIPVSRNRKEELIRLLEISGQ